jgi:ubiquitin-conjugating enzyme E2 variant
VLEFGAMLIAGALLATTGYVAWQALPSGCAWLAVGCVFLGLVVADFASGLVHWAADTYGNSSMPVLGSFVRTFREHHVDPDAITRHDLIETNGDVCLFSVPAHGTLLLWLENPWALAWITGLFLGSYSNSQIHKWAHSHDPPRAVRWLQSFGMVLSGAHHRLHHRGDHRTHYCITTGWLNAALDRMRFFAALERVLACLGARRA